MQRPTGPVPPLDLSVCIVTWNVKDDLARCLASLAEGNEDITWEVIVVDNASSDGTVQMLAECFPAVRVVANDVNVGFAAANVTAMREARGRFILLLNPDTTVPPGALSQLVRFAEHHPRAGVVGPKLVYADGRLQYSCRRFPTIGAALFRNTWLGRLIPQARSSQWYLMADWDHGDVRTVDWVSGACMLIRREAYEQVGELDPGFFWGSEDVDYCWRAWERGWQVVYTPTPVITHYVGRSTDQAVLRTVIRTHRSMYRLYCKHFARNPLARALAGVGIVLRAAMILTHYLVLMGWQRLLRNVQRCWDAARGVGR